MPALCIVLASLSALGPHRVNQGRAVYEKMFRCASSFLYMTHLALVALFHESLHARHPPPYTLTCSVTPLNQCLYFHPPMVLRHPPSTRCHDCCGSPPPATSASTHSLEAWPSSANLVLINFSA